MKQSNHKSDINELFQDKEENLKIRNKWIKDLDNKKPLNNKDKLIIWGKRSLIVFTLLGAAALTVIAVFLLNVLSTPVSILLWTMIFVFLLRGIVNALENKGVNRVLGTAIAYVIMFIIIALIGLFMFSPAFGLGEQIMSMIEQLPAYIEMVKEWALNIYNQYSDFLKNDQVKNWIDDIAGSLGNMGASIAGASATGIISAGGFIGNTFLCFGFSLVISFWILIELPALGREAKRFIKPKYKQDVAMWKIAFTHVMAGYIKGTFLQCFIIGVGAGVLFWILGIGNSGALGCITGVLNIIPIFGPWIGGAVAAMAGIFNSPLVAIIALAGTIAIQQFVYTFISPKIMSDSCNIHPVLSLLALMAGGALGGAIGGDVVGSLVGMLLSIPFVAVFKSLFVYYYEKRTGVRIVSERGVFFKGIPYTEDSTHPMFDALSFNPDETKKETKLKKKRLQKEAKEADKRDLEAKVTQSKEEKLKHKIEKEHLQEIKNNEKSNNIENIKKSKDAKIQDQQNSTSKDNLDSTDSIYTNKNIDSLKND